MVLQLSIRKDKPIIETSANIGSEELDLSLTKQSITINADNIYSEEVIDIIFARLSKGEPGKSAYQAAVDSGYSLSEEQFNKDLSQISTLSETINNKVDKVEGKQLSTEDFTTEYKKQVETIGNKVDKVEGKQLSTEDFTTEYKKQVETIGNKVDKVEGKQLSTEDFTTEYKKQVETIGNKVDKVEGKQLSTEDFTTEYKNGLDKLLGDSPGDGDNTKVEQDLLDFRKLFDSMFELDSNNNAIKAKLSLYSIGAISAMGIGSGGSNSGGGVSYDRLDSWADYTSDKAGYVLSALLGYDLNTRLSSVEGYYATKDYVTTKLVDYAPLASVQGFENRIGGLEGAVPQLNERVDSNDEQIAILNETTSGHTTSIGTLTQRVDSVEQLAATKLDSSYFTLTNIKSTLGISDWALAATKPSYAWSEITSCPTALSQFTDDMVAGYYLPLSGGRISNAKENVLYISSTSANSYLIFSANSRDSASVGYYNGLSYVANEFSSARIGVTNDGVPQYWDSYTGTNKYTLLHSGNIGNYNAGSATKLATARTIWGQSFDGTGDISGALTVGGDLNNAAGGIYIHQKNEINSFNGKLYLNHHGNGLAGYGSTNDIIMVFNGGNVGVGTSVVDERLTVSGNIKASGNINATSITINGVTLTASNGTITVNGNMAATGAVTAGA